MTDLSAFVSDIANASTTNVVCQVSVPGFAQALPVMILDRHLRGSRRSPLVVCFHGAIDQTKRRVPAFEGRFLLMNGLRGEATIVSIADPSLGLHRELKAAWYAGNEGTDTPAAITALVAELVRVLEPDRLVFVGGSTGAHAALVQSFRVPSSVAVVENPILHISGYNPRHIAEYRKFCWPRLARTASLPASVNDNVATLYARGHDNTVVLLNNTRDPHFWVQSGEFLNAIRRGQGRNRCLLYSDFFAEYPGHSYPAAVWARWVRAACGAPGTSVADIGQYHSENLPAPDRERTPAKPAASDIETAQRIYRELMAGGQAV